PYAVGRSVRRRWLADRIRYARPRWRRPEAGLRSCVWLPAAAKLFCGRECLRGFPEAVSGRCARRQCAVLAGRVALCPRTVQGRRECIPERLSDLSEEREGTRQSAQARHVARSAGPEGCGVLVV